MAASIGPNRLELPSFSSDAAANSAGSNTAGSLYYNTTDKVIKAFDGAGWAQLSNKFSAAGGTESLVGNYKYHTFTGSGSFSVQASGDVEYLIVAGGGGGGSSHAGAGGAGGNTRSSSTLVLGSYAVLGGRDRA